MIAFRGGEKGWATPRLVYFRGLFKIYDEHPRPFHIRVPPGPHPVYDKKCSFRYPV